MSDPDDNRKKIAAGRIVVWIVVGGIGLYLIVSGLIGIHGKDRLYRIAQLHQLLAVVAYGGDFAVKQVAPVRVAIAHQQIQYIVDSQLFTSDDCAGNIALSDEQHGYGAQK